MQLKRMKSSKSNRKRLFVALLLAVAFPSIHAQEGMERTAMEIIGEMNPGWNLGNTLEAINWRTSNPPIDENYGVGTETHWQSVKTSKQIIEFVKQQGFKAVRIPCNWMCGHIIDPQTHTIDPAWILRVKEVVKYCTDIGLYVVLNDHYDGGWVERSFDNITEDNVKEKETVMKNIWTQIATEFAEFDEHLLFAGLNEPDVDNQAKTNVLLRYEQAFIDAVRATGGNNAKRVLIVQGPSTDIDKTYSYMNSLPKDVVEGKLMLEVHYYSPWQFCGMEKDEDWGKMFYYWGSMNHSGGSPQRYGSQYEEAYMERQLDKMYSKFVEKGIPVIIGEYGANWRIVDENQTLHNQSIWYFYERINSLAAQRGMAAFAWDINYCNRPSMTIINRALKTIYNSYMMQGIKEAVTNIRQLNSIGGEECLDIYDLQGRKVEPGNGITPYKRGVYLQPGKAMLVK